MLEKQNTISSANPCVLDDDTIVTFFQQYTPSSPDRDERVMRLHKAFHYVFCYNVMFRINSSQHANTQRTEFCGAGFGKNWCTTLKATVLDIPMGRYHSHKDNIMNISIACQELNHLTATSIHFKPLSYGHLQRHG